DEPPGGVRLVVRQVAHGLGHGQAREDGHAVVGLLPEDLALIPQAGEDVEGEAVVRGLDLLETEHVRPLALRPGGDPLDAGADRIDVPGGDPHGWPPSTSSIRAATVRWRSMG